mmetsp:Transcript_35537/g.92631  ORF Transcript_35537/g.92631 Transcript_35537/m.92631 type:complete len:146 (-) Transcript_35537:1979-2416(-)
MGTKVGMNKNIHDYTLYRMSGKKREKQERKGKKKRAALRHLVPFQLRNYTTSLLYYLYYFFTTTQLLHCATMLNVKRNSWRIQFSTSSIHPSPFTLSLPISTVPTRVVLRHYLSTPPQHDGNMPSPAEYTCTHAYTNMIEQSWAS